MQGSGTVFAFDRDARRLQVLAGRMKLLGAQGVVECRRRDFMDVSPTDRRYREVTHILCDPSCSGSGQVTIYACFALCVVCRVLLLDCCWFLIDCC